jgi:hypothetical protein
MKGFIAGGSTKGQVGGRKRRVQCRDLSGGRGRRKKVKVERRGQGLGWVHSLHPSGRLHL